MICASGSVGGARPCQGRGRGFESRLALFRKFILLCASGSVGGARPCQGRGRGFESRLVLYITTKGHPKGCPFCCNRAPPGLEGSRSPLRSGRRKADVPRTSCAVSCSCLKPRNIVKSMLLGFLLPQNLRPNCVHSIKWAFYAHERDNPQPFRRSLFSLASTISRI